MMNEFREHLIDRRDQALDAAMHARGRLSDMLTECEDNLADAMADVARLQPYARWWMAVTNEFEYGGLDPMAALTKARTNARQALLAHTSPHTACFFTHGQSQAAIEATRRFYNETAFFNLDTITGTAPATPTITTTAPTAGPATGPTAGPNAGPMPPITGGRP
jgi:hypothetical protein